MEYIVFDLEFNQGFNRKHRKTFSDDLCPFEIIQIGAVKMNSNFQIIETFDTFVKPCIYTSMIHPYVAKITGIKLSDLSNAPKFKEAFAEFCKFISNNDPVLCVWGKSDIKEVYRNCAYHNIDCSEITKSCIDIQYYASKHINNSTSQQIGLENAIKHLGLDDSVSYHNALNDAYYTAKVFANIPNSKISPELYVYTGIKEEDVYGLDPYNEESFLDTCQNFSDILKRDLSKDEKNILSLAQYIKYDIDDIEIKKRCKSKKNRKKKLKKKR